MSGTVPRTGSVRSSSSCGSLGIGPDNISPERMQQQLKQNLDIELIKPKPENVNLMNHDDHGWPPTYDCVQFLIYCTEHDRFAVVDVDYRDSIWMPFVARDGQNWTRASETGLSNMFEKRDNDGMVVNHGNIPHTSKTIEFCHIQTAHVTRWMQRLTQFVTITKCQQTCQPVNNIRWMDAGTILKDDTLVWGPEFRSYLEHLEKRNFELQVVEYPIDFVFRYHTSANTAAATAAAAAAAAAANAAASGQSQQPQQHQQSPQTPHSASVEEKMNSLLDKIPKTVPVPNNTILAGLIRARNLSQKSLIDLYEHYLRHTYPSYFMNFGSFKIYLQKCGLKATELARAKPLFRCCLSRPHRDCDGKTYLDFHDLCFLLVAMDPETPHDRNRQAFINLYLEHDLEAAKEMRRSKSNQDKNRGKEAATTAGSNTSTSSTELQSALCRLPRSVFFKFGGIKKKKERLESDKSNLSRGLCRNCRVKAFEYGQHCVMFDSMGRCVEPKIILNADNQFTPISKLEGKKLYSAEHVFKTDSIGNALFDYLRNRRFLGGAGTSEVQKVHLEYLMNAILIICESVRKLVKCEPKLIKRSGPAVIIGDINGSLETLFNLENHFWRAMPVLAPNLIFLGNFTGTGTYSVETVLYLFALKYLSPNKVILLKGVQETRAVNEHTLLVECRQRYGDDQGERIWNSINHVYEELPNMAVVNETIPCTPSGIPKDAIKYRLTNLFDNYVIEKQKSPSQQSQMRECAIFHQIMVNLPTSVDKPGDQQPPKSSASERSSSGKKRHNHKRSASAKNSATSNQSSKQTITSGKDGKPGAGGLFRPNPDVPNGFFFTREAFRQFMNLNHYHYMIRGNDHQLPDPAIGFQTMFNNRLISLVSYTETAPETTKNETLVLFVHHPRGQLQLMRLEYDPQNCSLAQSFTNTDNSSEK